MSTQDSPHRKRPMSRARMLAAAARARSADGYSYDADRIRQRCPSCWSYVTKAAPTDQRDSRAINDALDDAVCEHLRRDCPATRTDRP